MAEVEEDATGEFMEDPDEIFSDEDTDVWHAEALTDEAEDKTEDITEQDEDAKPKKKMERPWNFKRCMEGKWVCDDMPLWRAYMNTYIEDVQELEKNDTSKRRKPANLAKFPRFKSEEEILTPCEGLPFNALQLKNLTCMPDNLNRKNMIRIWRNMRKDALIRASTSNVDLGSRVSKIESAQWPGLRPCTTRDLMKELRERCRQKKILRRDLFPCDVQEEEQILNDQNDFSERKELGHVRLPQKLPIILKNLVDRDAGEHPGLVDGDYIIFELFSKTRGDRVYADVCLHGLKGMHLPELGPLRARQKTWKFCFYQAIVALLAKTQLRYKYAWSANIDYIYDHAWMLFAHIGGINIKEQQRLDDIVVYNYKYSVQLDLIQELHDVPIVTDVSWDFEERNLRRKTVLERKELMHVKLEIGSEKLTDQQNTPVHKGVKLIEDWFDKLPIKYRNCIFRTTRFSVAFWKDSNFWYLYNPYRCDSFGYWDDDGYACILKFCSRQSLKRHLMILLLRAYAYSTPSSIVPKNGTKMSIETDDEMSYPGESETTEEQFFTIQIFHLIHHCCQIHNLKLLQRGAPKLSKRLVEAKTIDDCPFDPLDIRDPCAIEQENGDLQEAIEKPTWLKLYKMSWAKCLPSNQKKKSSSKEAPAQPKMRWHQYVVEESNKLFSLWGEIHITDGMFEKENRGMQTYACYVVCAGMTRIMAPEYWNSKTLDVIVMCGDRYYTHSKLEAKFKSNKNDYSHVNCWNRYLMSHFNIGETMFETKVLPAICGRLYAKSSKYLWQSLEQMFLKYHFGILTCESSCFGVFKFCGAYYVCDVNAFGPPLFNYGQGAAYMLRATYFSKFMTVIVLMIGTPECSRFALNPIEILKVVEVGPVGYPVVRMDNKDKGVIKVDCPYDEEKKKQMKRWKHRRAETARTIDKMCCKGE